MHNAVVYDNGLKKTINNKKIIICGELHSEQCEALKREIVLSRSFGIELWVSLKVKEGEGSGQHGTLQRY